MTYQRCNNCNGSGTILNHQHYSHSGQRSAGQGMSVCPSCNGSGHNGALDLSSKKYNGKSPSEIQGEKIGEGCATVFFPIIPYLIVLYALFNLVTYGINILSNTYEFNAPEWLPITAILSLFSMVLFYKKFIGRIAILSIIILIGNSYLLSDENYKTLVQKTSAKPMISSSLTPKNKSNISKTTVQKPTLLDQCRSCSKILTFRGKLPPSIKEGKRRYCERFKPKCIKQGYKW